MNKRRGLVQVKVKVRLVGRRRRRRVQAMTDRVGVTVHVTYLEGKPCVSLVL
jgi:hypothetical protein